MGTGDHWRTTRKREPKNKTERSKNINPESVCGI